MFRDFLATSGLLHLPVAATLIFAFVFAAVLISTLFGRRPPGSFDRVAGLPLEDDLLVDDRQGKGTERGVAR